MLLWSAWGNACFSAEPQSVSPDAVPLVAEGDFSEQMRTGIERFLSRATANAKNDERRLWMRGHATPEDRLLATEPFRQRFRTIIGAVDQRQSPVRLAYQASPHSPNLVAQNDQYCVYSVRWNVFFDVHGEGLLWEPRGKPIARIVAVPDADQTPEMLAGLARGIPAASQFAHSLAAAGCQVLVPVLVDRQCTWSGNPDVAMTNQTHREWVWRQSVELGRHLIGYEVQKVQAAVDWFTALNADDEDIPIGAVGYGEGGLIVFYAAAVDQRIDAVLVSGYFDSRERLFAEPIYRGVFGLLREFGDAEIASLIVPRHLVVEHSTGPDVPAPPAAESGRRETAAPGAIVPPPFPAVKGEFERALKLTSTSPYAPQCPLNLVHGDHDQTIGPGSPEALQKLFDGLHVEPAGRASRADTLVDARRGFDPAERQRRQVVELVEHSQRLLRSAKTMRSGLWTKASGQSAETWHEATRADRDLLWRNILGKLPDPTLLLNVRARRIFDRPTCTGYEVMLDVWEGVFAWGYLVVPKDLGPTDRRPVVVCQHGLEGVPESVVTEDESDRAFRAYRAYAVRLAERGFVTFAPHNPYRGGTAFRQIQRRANPLGLTLYSFILGQHQQILEWLATLPFVDPQRIGFYGLSYGGVSALRIPALLDEYCLSICSAAFNDWPRKIMAIDFSAGYMFTHEYEHFTFGLGNTYSNAELAALIAPRPFMVERGHRDGVAPDEWVAHEYATVRRLYAQLGIPERTEIEFFDGGHVINGQGTFEFLHRHLKWPHRPAAEQ